MSLINTDQRDHLKLLRENSPEVAIEICKLSLDYLNNGPNLNRYQAVASKLNVTIASLQDAINALIMLQLNKIKANVSEEEFSLITDTGFTPEQISILWQFVTSKRSFVSNILNQFGIVEYRFRDLDWRLEARIASRCLLNQSTPFITIKFYLDSETITEQKDRLHHTNNSSQNENDMVVAMQPEHHRRKKEMILQTDPNNLVYMISVLEKAWDETKTHRVRNIVKAI